MSSSSLTKQFLLALSAVCLMATLTACGGSSSNVSPGAIVVPPDEPDSPNVPVDPIDPPPTDGGTVKSVIPSNLGSAIYDSGETAPDGKSIYIIDVAALPGGALNPAGLLLGNDFIFRIEGGALRIAQN